MECVIFAGIQASGKSSFYKQYFFNSHVRINLDMLKTRHKEDIYLAASFKAHQKFVVDNTNPTRLARKKYIDLANTFGYKVIGYFFVPDLEGSLHRNQARPGTERVPVVAIKGTRNKLEVTQYDEGFHELFHVILQDDQFIVTKLTKGT